MLPRSLTCQPADCVEHLPAPQTDPLPGGDGFAQYVSCNSDECDGAKLSVGGNGPREPYCICWVWCARRASAGTISADRSLVWDGAQSAQLTPLSGASRDDRMISHVPKSKLLADCSTDVHLPWVGSNQCNCSKGKDGSAATDLPPDSPMANYVGRCEPPPSPSPRRQRRQHLELALTRSTPVGRL